MPRVETGHPVSPLSLGLRDKFGHRMVPPGAAAEMDRIEHNRMAAEGGRGSVRVTREAPKTAALRFGRETFRNGEGAYALIPAQDRYFDLIDTATDFSLEFTLRIDEIPDSTSDSRTLICCGTPYTTDRFSWEVNLIERTGGNGAWLQLAWRSGGVRHALAWNHDLHLRTTYSVRIVFRFTGGPGDNVDLYVDNDLKDTIQNNIAGYRPFEAVNAPLYVGGKGGYPNAGSSNNAAKVSLCELRLWSTELDPLDDDVIRFTGERLVPSEHGNESNLEGWWPMDDGYGRVVRDRSRWSNDAYFGPSAIVTRKGLKAQDGAIFLDGHTASLIADYRFRDLIREEFEPNNQNGTSGMRYGLSVRVAVLDKSPMDGGNATAIADLHGDQRRNRSLAQLLVGSGTGLITGRTYNAGALQDLTGPEVDSGQMRMIEYFFDGTASPNQSLYVDGEEVDTSGLLSGEADPLYGLRIGSRVNIGAPWNQTPWSARSDTNHGTPLLVEEVRVWLEYLDGDQVAERWEKSLDPDQVIETLGAATGEYTQDLATVEADSALDTGFINSYLVPGDELPVLEEDIDKRRDEPKLYHISNIAGSTITLSNPDGYEGKSARGKSVRATRLGGYWKVPGPDAEVAVSDTAELRRPDDVEPKPVPDERGFLVEDDSAVGHITAIEDESPAGTPLTLGIEPYENGTPPGRVLPLWRSGLIGRHDSPGRRIVAYDAPGYDTIAVYQHGSCLYEVDDRWRGSGPYEDSSSLAFRHNDHAVRAPNSSNLVLGNTETTWFAYRTWVRFDETGSEGKKAIACMASETDNGDANWLFFVERGRLKLRSVNGGNGREYSSDEVRINRGQWHHVVWVHANGTFHLFVDGELLTTSFVNIGSGFVGFASVSSDLYVGNCPEVFRTEFSAFRGNMADIQTVNAATQVAGIPSTPFVPPSSDEQTYADAHLHYRCDELEDAVLFNLVSGGARADMHGPQLLPLMEGLGEPAGGDVPSIVSHNERLYATTGQGAPQVFDREYEHARRMGIVPPSYAPEVDVESVTWWQEINPDYAGTNKEDEDHKNFSLRFRFGNFVRVDHKSGVGMDLQGDRAAADTGDTGMWDLWCKPNRLDRKMVLFGKNFHDQGGNYAVVLIPNDAKTALKVRFTFWDLETRSFKWFETDDYPLDDTGAWYYLWLYTQYGAPYGAGGASRNEQIRIGKVTGATGGGLTVYAHGGANDLLDSGDLGLDDRPDDGSAHIHIGSSPIGAYDPSYFGFDGYIAEFRMVSDTDGDTTHFSSPITGPTNSPDHIFKNDPTDAAYETGGAAVAGTNAAEVNTSVFVLNMNTGYGNDLEDAGSNAVTATLVTDKALTALQGTILTRVTFYDPDTGIESNPGPAHQLDYRAGQDAGLEAFNWIKVTGVPQSPDRRPRLHRRIYRTPAGVTNYYLAATIEDNESSTVVLDQVDAVLVQSTPISFVRSYPPFHLVALAGDSRYYAGRLRGPGALFSEPFIPEYMQATNFIPLDSDRGGLVKAFGTIFGQLVVFLEDAAFVVQEQGGAHQISVVGSDGGCLSNGSVVQADRSLIRPGEQGIYAFAGVSDFYRGGPIGPPEGTWGLLDRGFRAITGAYWRERDQAIWIFRREGDARAKTRIALDLSTNRGGESPPNVFTVSDGPELACIGVVQDREGVRQLWGADHLGMISRLDQGERDGPRVNRDYGSVAGIVGNLASTTVIPVDETDVDVAGDGHRGQVLTIFAKDGRIYSGRVRSNTNSEFTLLDALPEAPAQGSAWELGTYRRSWKTGFISYGDLDEAKSAGTFVASFERRPGHLMRVRAWIDYDTDKMFEIGDFPMDEGFLEGRLASKLPSFRYLQLEFSSRSAFVLYDYTVGSHRSRPRISKG